MTRPSPLRVAAAFPSSILLLYLSMHVTEGWQLLVVALFGAGFVSAWLRHSPLLLVASYVLTTCLCGWVVVANLG